MLVSTTVRGTRASKPRIVTDPPSAASSTGLRYVTDAGPGFARAKRGKKFLYLDAAGRTIRDRRTLARLTALAIPPAWNDVWICPVAEGHLQATGRDSRGRKQHLYHERWREVRDETKYNRMILFARRLPQIRRRVATDLRLGGLPRRKALAAVTRLLEVSLIRVGNEEYARENRSFGLTTMRDRHVNVSGSKLRFSFRGKGGKEHTVAIDDRRLATIVKNCQEIPGQELFQYLDEEQQRRSVTSGDVNDYLREISGSEFTAKDFRTWAGTVLAAWALREFEKFDSQAQAKKNIVRAIEMVAERLGNTPSICRKCYVHPAVIDSYFGGSMLRVPRRRARGRIVASRGRLSREEAAVLTLLVQRLAADFRGEGLPTHRESPVKTRRRTLGRARTLVRRPSRR